MIRKLSGPLSELFKKVVKKAGMGTGDFLTRRRPGGRKKVVKKSWYGSALLWHSVCGGLNINCGKGCQQKHIWVGSLLAFNLWWAEVKLTWAQTKNNDEELCLLINHVLILNQSRFDTSVMGWMEIWLTWTVKLIHRVRLKGLPITIDQSSDQNNDESWRAIIVC